MRTDILKATTKKSQKIRIRFQEYYARYYGVREVGSIIMAIKQYGYSEIIYIESIYGDEVVGFQYAFGKN